jgi:hypothetical protein
MKSSYLVFEVSFSVLQRPAASSLPQIHLPCTPRQVSTWLGQKGRLLLLLLLASDAPSRAVATNVPLCKGLQPTSKTYTFKWRTEKTLSRTLSCKPISDGCAVGKSFPWESRAESAATRVPALEPAE